MRMEENCGEGILPSCTGNSKEEVNESVTKLHATDSSISCDTNAAASGLTQEKLDKDYCMEATKLILDLSKYGRDWCVMTYENVTFYH